jgi:hypothetical protein
MFIPRLADLRNLCTSYWGNRHNVMSFRRISMASCNCRHQCYSKHKDFADLEGLLTAIRLNGFLRIMQICI